MENNLDALITYDITNALIADLKARCLALKVSGFDDKDGYMLCKTHKADIKSRRVAIERRRKELKEDSLAFGRKVDAKAREYTQELQEMEDYLQSQLGIIDDEIERRKLEADLKRQAIVADRVSKLQAVNAEWPTNIGEIPDAMFEAMLFAATQANDERLASIQAEKERIANIEKENARLKAEAEAKAAAEKVEREKLEAEVRKLKAEAEAKEAAERQAKQREIDKEEAEKRARADMEKAQKAKDLARQKELEAEHRRVLEEEKARQAKAQKEIEDEKLFNYIKENFPTLEVAWVEIARLTKLLKGK